MVIIIVMIYDQYDHDDLCNDDDDQHDDDDHFNDDVDDQGYDHN